MDQDKHRHHGFRIRDRTVRALCQTVDNPGRQRGSSPHGITTVFGIILVASAVLMGVLAFFRHRNVERQIDQDAHEHSLALNIMLSLAVAVIGLFLVLYLIHTL